MVPRREEYLLAAIVSGSRQRMRLKKSRSFPVAAEGRKVGDGDVRRPQILGTDKELLGVFDVVIVAAELASDVEAENLLFDGSTSLRCV